MYNEVDLYETSQLSQSITVRKLESVKRRTSNVGVSTV
jgi:hypothetical protein